MALLIGLALQMVLRPDSRRAVSELPWSAVLLTSAIMVYVGVLERTGTLKAIAEHLGGIDNTLLAVLAVSYIAAVFATVEPRRSPCSAWSSHWPPRCCRIPTRHASPCC
ncbi:hypothetical protein [Streptomyces sp. NPDC056723]|uniref:hypothetical protein n=1 Tax=Streptomyces sp. NPDC056723 TaxID=3345925 RepID=UPI0036A3B28D